MSAFKAGAAYFALVFLIGFALGTLRVLVLAPRLGTFRAVIVELPVILTASWMVCGWILRRFGVPPRAGPRVRMGGTAFVFLIGAEILLASAAGRDPGAYITSWGTTEGALGLAGQVVFALFPLMRLRTGPEQSSRWS